MGRNPVRKATAAELPAGLANGHLTNGSDGAWQGVTRGFCGQFFGPPGRFFFDNVGIPGSAPGGEAPERRIKGFGVAPE